MFGAKILTQRSSSKKLTYPIDCNDSECYPVNIQQIIAINSNRHFVVLSVLDSFSVFSNLAPVSRLDIFIERACPVVTFICGFNYWWQSMLLDLLPLIVTDKISHAMKQRAGFHEIGIHYWNLVFILAHFWSKLPVSMVLPLLYKVFWYLRTGTLNFIILIIMLAMIIIMVMTWQPPLLSGGVHRSTQLEQKIHT